MPSHLGYGMHVPFLDRSPKVTSEYHTLTNLVFKKPTKMQNRYKVMNRPSSVNLPFLTSSAESPRSPMLGFQAMPPDVSDDDFKQSGGQYAKFLKEHERTLGPTGFLDSTRYTHTFNVKELSTAAKQANFRIDKEPTTAVALTNRIAGDQKEFEKKMKVIEDHMWQHKQEERELKRVEGDVTKKKRAVVRTMREVENAMSKKMLDEEKRLNESIQQMEKVRTEGVHVKEERTKGRITKAHTDLQMIKSKMRKSELVTTDAERQYRSKLSELEMHKDQIVRLSREFEDRLKRKENETANLAKELANLAIDMNMESMKGRTIDEEYKRQERIQASKYINDDKTQSAGVNKKLSQSDGIYRASENRRRQASATLSSTKAHLSERTREGDRRVTDNRNLVESNIAAQKKLQEAAEAAELDKRRKQYQRNVQAHILRKNVGLRKIKTARLRTSQERSDNWEKTFDQNYRDYRRRRNEDLLRTFARVATHDNETDHQLHQKCRQLEYDRKRQEKETQKLESQLIKTRFRNTSNVQEVTHDADDKDADLKRKVLLAKASLIKMQNQRSTSEWMLRKFRGTAKETEYVYNELARENKRLLKIGSRTDTYLDQQAMAVA